MDPWVQRVPWVLPDRLVQRLMWVWMQTKMVSRIGWSKWRGQTPWMPPVCRQTKMATASPMRWSVHRVHPGPSEHRVLRGKQVLQECRVPLASWVRKAQRVPPVLRVQRVPWALLAVPVPAGRLGRREIRGSAGT